MRQCEDCEFFRRGQDGEISISCDPFRNAKEPECLAKWQLLKANQLLVKMHQLLGTTNEMSTRLNQMVAAY